MTVQQHIVGVRVFTGCMVNPLGQKFPLKTQGYPLRRLFGWLCCQHGLSRVCKLMDTGLTLFFRCKS